MLPAQRGHPARVANPDGNDVGRPSSPAGSFRLLAGMSITTAFGLIAIGLGLLFGATDATPDMTVKWDLEIAF